MKFELDTTDGRARRGRLVFDRGVVETPAFMPVGTYAILPYDDFMKMVAYRKMYEFMLPLIDERAQKQVQEEQKRFGL